MEMNIFRLLAGAVLALALGACGGGGGSPGTQPGDTSDTGDTATVSDVVFELDKITIGNSGSDVAELKVTVLDSKRNVIAGVPVIVSLTSGVFQRSSDILTDDNGQFSGAVGVGGDKSNRVIDIDIRVGDLIRKASVQVTGSQIGVVPIPATPSAKQQVTLNLSTSDSAGAPIPNVALLIESSIFTDSISKTTDLSGNAIVNFVAPEEVGKYTITVKALGTSTERVVEVIASGNSGKPDAVGLVSTASLTANPSSIQPNTDSSKVNRAKLSAKFQAKDNAGIENIRVRFEITGDKLGGGEAISTGDATIYTDSSGVAESDYIAGIRSSPTNGVNLRACYSLKDFESLTDCPNEVATTLTVAGSPLSIGIGDNNLLEKGLGDIAYIKKFLIQVNDAAGVAVKDAIVSVSVDITHYGKGFAWGQPYEKVSVPNARYIHEDYDPNPLPSKPLRELQSSLNGPLPLSGTPPRGSNIWCLNEDWNRNGFLDRNEITDINGLLISEDINGDGSLQPKKAEIIVSYVSGNKTDQNGQLLVQIAYPQNMGRWLAYTLRATTSVAGSEGDASKSYVTDVLEGDVENGSFLTPPFGRGNCRSPG
jgi:hypothetical protein